MKFTRNLEPTSTYPFEIKNYKVTNSQKLFNFIVVNTNKPRQGRVTIEKVKALK